jgi:hypothetical protein
MHCTHLWVGTSHLGVLPKQSTSLMHCTHCPAEQRVVPLHTRPHAPQLPTSLVKSMHAPEQHPCPVPHCLQVPFCPPPQIAFVSLATATHAVPLQQPFAHDVAVHTHWPALHAWPAAQA